MRPLKDLSVYEKQEIVLECEFSKSNVDAVWQKDGLDIKYSFDSNRISKTVIGTVHKLVIYEAQLSDSSDYSCAVKRLRTSCNVKVKGKHE